jgi:hypothetical protein
MRYGIGWQEEHEALRRASLNPIPAFKGGGGYIHVPGQTGMYAEYLARGGPPEGIGTARLTAGGRMAAYRSGVRLAGSALRAPITYTSIRGVPTFVPTESLKGGEQFMPLSGTSTASFGSAASGLAAGGSALARGGPAVGSIPGGGLGIVAAAGGGGLTVAEGLGIGGIGSSITNAGTGIINTVKEYIPLAIKIGAAVIGIKMLLWLVRKK